MRRSLWGLLAMGLSATACAGASSEGDGILVVDYSAAFQAAAAVEYDALAVSCQPNDPTTPPGCSAIKSMINDYGQLRARLRVE